VEKVSQGDKRWIRAPETCQVRREIGCVPETEDIPTADSLITGDQVWERFPRLLRVTRETMDEDNGRLLPGVSVGNKDRGSRSHSDGLLSQILE
jgi:hypothetical protein